MPDWETAKALGLELPDTVEGTSYGTPALKVRDKMFARLREDGETLVVWTDFLEREALCRRGGAAGAADRVLAPAGAETGAAGVRRGRGDISPVIAR
jgi:hypothetical protein